MQSALAKSPKLICLPADVLIASDDDPTSFCNATQPLVIGAVLRKNILVRDEGNIVLFEGFLKGAGPCATVDKQGYFFRRLAARIGAPLRFLVR